MRILKAGDPSKNINKRVRGTCQNCGCVIECSKDECRLIQDVVGQPGYYAIYCPNCADWIKIN